MIEAGCVSLGGRRMRIQWMSQVASFHLVLNNHFIREHFSSTPIDFEQKPITMNSLNEKDLIVRQQLSSADQCPKRSPSSLFRSFFFYALNKMCTSTEANQYWILICSILRRIYTLQIRGIGGWPPWNKRSVSIPLSNTDWRLFCICLVHRRNSLLTWQPFVWTMNESLTFRRI